MVTVVIRCPQTKRPVATGLTTDGVIFETLPPVALPLRCPACGHVHRWKPEDAWVAQDGNGLKEQIFGADNLIRTRPAAVANKIE